MGAKWGLAFSDPHCGSIWGLRPEQIYLSEDGSCIETGKVGTALHEAFQAIVKRYQKPDFLLVGGDNVEGAQRKSKGEGIWSTDLAAQGDVAVALINQFKAKHVYCVRGTEYHVHDGTNADEYVANQLANVVAREGRKAPPDRYLDVNGCVIHLSHKLGGTKVFQYRGTPPARELTMNRVMSKETETYHCNLILRGHVHCFYMVQAGPRSICATIPCWKARDDYSARENPFVWMPQIGVLVIEVAANGHFTVTPDIVEFAIQRPPMETL